MVTLPTNPKKVVRLSKTHELFRRGTELNTSSIFLPFLIQNSKVTVEKQRKTKLPELWAIFLSLH